MTVKQVLSLSTSFNSHILRPHSPIIINPIIIAMKGKFAMEYRSLNPYNWPTPFVSRGEREINRRVHGPQILHSPGGESIEFLVKPSSLQRLPFLLMCKTYGFALIQGSYARGNVLCCSFRHSCSVVFQCTQKYH